MIVLIRLLFVMLVSPFKSRSRLKAENAALRQQLIILRRKAKGRAKLTNGDRWFFVQLYRRRTAMIRDTQTPQSSWERG